MSEAEPKLYKVDLGLGVKAPASRIPFVIYEPVRAVVLTAVRLYADFD
jgi:hypothetical protein